MMFMISCSSGGGGSSSSDSDTTPTPTLSAKAITAFSFASPAAEGTITESNHSIAITVPSGTNVKALIPAITHTGASINPASGVAQDFTNPVIYTVTAADSSMQDYTITVTVDASPSASDTWTKKADFGGGGRAYAVRFSIGNKGYIGMGWDGSLVHNDFWAYDPALNIWIQKADGPLQSDGAAFSIGSKGYIVTGYDGSSKTKASWMYDPAANTWTRKADFGGTARVATIGFSIGSKGYVGTGETGKDGSPYTNDFWEFDPTANTWTRKADFGGGIRYGAVGFSIGSIGYIGGGSNGENDIDNDNDNDFWAYNPIADTWTRKADCGDFAGGTPYNAVGFSIGNKGYIGTGSDGWPRAYLKDFWEYDPATNTWTKKADFGGTGRMAAVGFSIGNRGYIGTGWQQDSSSFYSDFWEYEP